MPTNVLMPQMGESIAEGTIVRWVKNVGDHVDRDEPLFEISTDKVDAEIPSPAAGVLTEIRAKEGETVPVNHVVAVIDPAPGPAPPRRRASRSRPRSRPRPPPRPLVPGSPKPRAKAFRRPRWCWRRLRKRKRPRICAIRNRRPSSGALPPSTASTFR